MKRFSIVLPFFNDASTIAQTLDSLRAQTFGKWEAICIDDGATDGTADIVAGYAERDVRIRVMRNTGKGPSDARNLGAGQARGDILAFCDADDLWTNDKLMVLESVYRQSLCDGAFGQIGFFTENPADSRTRSTVPETPLTIEALLAENPVCTMSNLTIRREVFASCDGLDSSVVHNEDLEFLIRLVGTGHNVIGVDHLQVWYRNSPSGLSSNLRAMQTGRRRAIETAARFGVSPTQASEAVYMRYLARRALRVGRTRREAWQYTCQGLRLDALSFLSPVRRGAPTAVASALALALTPGARRALFSR